MKCENVAEDRHLCPDCQNEETQGRDTFGFPMPCARCMVERLVRAFHADMEERALPVGKRSRAGAGRAWSRRLA